MQRAICGFRLGLDSALLCGSKNLWDQVLCVLMLEELEESTEPR